AWRWGSSACGCAPTDASWWGPSRSSTSPRTWRPPRLRSAHEAHLRRPRTPARGVVRAGEAPTLGGHRDPHGPGVQTARGDREQHAAALGEGGEAGPARDGLAALVLPAARPEDPQPLVDHDLRQELGAPVAVEVEPDLHLVPGACLAGERHGDGRGVLRGTGVEPDPPD